MKKQNEVLIKMMLSEYGGDKETTERAKKTIESIDSYLLSLDSPKSFGANSPGNVMRGADLSFEDIVSVLEKAGVKDPKRLSIFEFNSKIEFLKKENKTKK